jgi:hypothetical protein
MMLEDVAHGVWRQVQAFARALDYSEHAELRSRVARLERLTADLDKTVR